MRMSGRRRLILAAVLVIMQSAGARAGTFKTPDIPDGEKLTYRVFERSESAENRESFISPREEITGITQIITRFPKAGKPYYRFFRAEKLSGGHTNYYTYIFTDFAPFRFVAFEKRMQSPNGRVVKKEISYFDDPIYRFPADLNHFFSIPMTARGLEFKLNAHNDLQIWFSSHFTPWRMDILVMGREQVTVPAGTFDCWKVRVEPNLESILHKWAWIARLLKPFIPNFYYWFAVKPPFPVIKFEGTFGPVGFSPVQVQELTKVGAATEADLEMVRSFSSSPAEIVLWEDFQAGRR